MLFSRLSLVSLFGLAATALASSSSREPAALEKRLSVAAEASITAALQVCVVSVQELGVELAGALEGVKTGNAAAVVEVAGPILTDMTAAVTVAVHAVVKVSKRDLQTRNFDLNTIGALVADLINAVLVALKPLEEHLSASPALGPLLAPFLLPLNTQLVLLLNSLFAVVVGLLNVVLNLLRGTVIVPLLRHLGLGPVLSILTL
ncbi:hypothetical protein JCM8208_000571 [Rhodotorula glutinis]